MAWIVIGDTDNALHITVMVLLAACIGYLLYKIWPYLPFAKKEMKTVTGAVTANQIKIFGGNVLEDNDHYDEFFNQIKEVDPDIVLLLETNKLWQQHMDRLEETHPYTLKQAQENTYGILFYSKLKLKEGSVKFLAEKDVPSIEAIIELPSGQLVKLFGLHPKPPVPGESNRSKAKDKELMKVAFKAKEEQLPVIVAGDLNDVAWSYVTELFRKTSELIDPRRGRGFYSTFSAKSWFFRFPLDYVFCSNDFVLISMKRLKSCGSDHFPILSHFEYNPTLKSQQQKPKANEQEKEEAIDKVNQ